MSLLRFLLALQIVGLLFAPMVNALVTGSGSQQLQDGQGGLLTPGFAFANDGLGRALAVGDFNNDSFDDLVVAEMESLTGQSEGAVRVIYGSAGGLLGIVSLPPQLIYDFLPASGALDREAGDYFGDALAAGDFDCDQYDDLAIGIPGENVAGASAAGAVLLLHGSALGLVTTNLNGYAPVRFTQGMDATGGQAESGDRFGAALAVGNFDYGSGRDLAVGIPGEDGERGSVLVLYSAFNGVCHFLGDALPSYVNQDTSGILDTSETGDQFGFALATGDFQGDHADDLVIGVVGEDINGQADAGAVAVIYGISQMGLRETNNQLWIESVAEAGGFVEQGDRFGEVLATGDLDGNGVDDLAIGAPAEDVSFHEDAGAVTVLYSSPSIGVVTTGAQLLDQAGLLDGDSLGDFDNFGYSLTIGDVVDGAVAGKDLVIGIPQESIGESFVYPQQGAVTMVPGGGAALATSRAVLWSKGFFGSAGTLELSPEFYGYTITRGDFDGNGWDDIAIGAILVEGVSPSGAATNSGAVYTLYGSAQVNDIFADGFDSGG